MTRSAPKHGLQLLVTCEHASPAVPKELADLGLPRAVLRSHRGWDPGALGIAEAIARTFAVPLHRGQWSRLVADLNRSEDHARVVAAKVDGALVPGNQLDKAALAQRLARYWRPYRQKTRRAITAAAWRGGVLHLSVHSFTPKLGGVERRNDVGLLCDPRRVREVAFCEALKVELVARGLSVRRNFPYFGDTDGLTTHLRGQLRASQYLGIEIECNQRLVGKATGERRVAKVLVAALRALGFGARRRDQTAAFAESEFEHHPALVSDFALHLRRVEAIVKGAQDVRTAWQAMASFVGRGAGHAVARALGAVRIEDDVAAVTRHLRSLLSRRPLSAGIDALWFGLFDSVDADDREGVGYYVAGVRGFDAADPDSLCNPAWWPKERYLSSLALSVVKEHELAARERGDDAAEAFLSYAGRLGVALVLSRFAAAHLAGNRALVVGFDSGDYVVLGP